MERRSVNSVGMFDAIKGIFVLGMVLRHSIWRYENLVYTLSLNSRLFQIIHFLIRIGAYGVIPMLFMICGYGHRKTTMKKAIVRQVKFVWKPYLILVLTVILTAIVKKLLTHGDVWEGICYQGLPFLVGAAPGGTYFGVEIAFVGSAWFIITFVLSGILLNLILQEEETWMQLLLVSMSAAVSVTLSRYRIPFCILQSLVSTFYMYIGWQMKNSKFLGKRIPKYYWILALVFIVFSACYGEMDVSGNNWKNGLADVLAGAVCGGVFLLLMLRLNRFNGIVMRFIRWLGRQIMFFCLIHSAFTVLTPWVKIVEKCRGSMMAESILALSIYLVTGIGGCWLLEKIQRKRADRKLKT